MAFHSDYPAMIAEAEDKLLALETTLEEITKMKAQEPSIKNEVAALKTQIAEWQGEQAFYGKAEAEDSKDGKTTPAKQSTPKQKPAAAPAEVKADDPEEAKKKRMKALNKKLQQIEKLKTKEGALDEDEKTKLSSEKELLKEIDCLKRGEVYIAPGGIEEKKEETKEEVAEKPTITRQTVKLPSDPAEREKRLKALRKKLQQIEQLKAKGGEMDAEAVAKIASQCKVQVEIDALEQGAEDVVFDEAELKSAEEGAEKVEAEKKLKALKKKLAQIQELKNSGKELDADAQAKVSGEAAIKKEAGALEARIGKIAKIERERVANKLGFADEVKAQKKEQNAAGKLKKKGQA